MLYTDTHLHVYMYVYDATTHSGMTDRVKRTTLFRNQKGFLDASPHELQTPWGM